MEEHNKKNQFLVNVIDNGCAISYGSKSMNLKVKHFDLLENEDLKENKNNFNSIMES